MKTLFKFSSKACSTLFSTSLVALKIVLTFSLISFSFISHADAKKSSNQLEEVPINSIAAYALKSAINDANQRLTNYNESAQTFTLLQTSEDKEGNVLTEKFSTHLSEISTDGSWEVLTKDTEFNPTIEVSNDIFFDSTNMNINDAKLIAETANTWIFRTPNAINVESNDDVEADELANADDAIAAYLLTELIIDKKNAKVIGLKIYAKEPFKPSMLVEIEKFEMRLSFKEAWPDGPLVRTDFSRHIKGSYGWLYSMEDLVTTQVSNIQRIN